MTEEEKKALADAEAAKATEAAKAGDGAGGEDKSKDESNPLEEKDKRIKELEEERDNYKTVALKRLGKLPGDKEFSESELSVAEQIRLALLDKEIENERKAEAEEKRKLVKENSELRIALKNRPNGSIGGESGGSVETKDNVFTTEQIAELTARAKKLGADPLKFIESAKKNLNNRR